MANKLPTSMPSAPCPRAANRARQQWCCCIQCGEWFGASLHRILTGAVRYCSRPCGAAHKRDTGALAGANNPRWAGGVSTDWMRYKRRAVAKAPEKDRARQMVYDAVKAQIAQLSPADQAKLDSGTTKIDFEPVASGRAQTAINFALAQLGEPYSWGGTGPGSWDCSGLMLKSWAAAGISLPRVVGPQYAATKHISASQLQPGDLVFYGDMSHNGMYLGKGRVVHSPRPGRSVEITGLGGFSKFGRVG